MSKETQNPENRRWWHPVGLTERVFGAEIYPSQPQGARAGQLFQRPVTGLFIYYMNCCVNSGDSGVGPQEEAATVNPPWGRSGRRREKGFH